LFSLIIFRYDCWVGSTDVGDLAPLSPSSSLFFSLSPTSVTADQLQLLQYANEILPLLLTDL
jgi:hypothetical protein